MTEELHVVLGATGGAGRAIAKALAEDGLRTRTVSRTGETVHALADPVAADIETAGEALRAVEGASVVYMAAQPPYTKWRERFPDMLDAAVGATAAVGAKFVMVDNLYGYGPVTEPMGETTPERATDKKGVVRRQMTTTLLSQHHAGRLRVVIGRASDYFGPDCTNSGISQLVMGPAAAGKTMRWIARDDMPHSVAYLPDVARAYVTLGRSDRADGEIWHVPHGPALTGAALMSEVRRVADRTLESGVVSKTMLRLASPFHPISRETLGIIHQWDRPFVVDDSKFRSAFGFADTPLDEALAASLAWLRDPASAG